MNLTCPPEYPHDSEIGKAKGRCAPAHGSTAAYNRTLWSEIPPNSAGWWWLLWHGELHVVRVKHETDNQFYYVRSDIIPAFTDHWTNVKNIDGLWAGPIPLPSEP